MNKYMNFRDSFNRKKSHWNFLYNYNPLTKKQTYQQTQKAERQQQTNKQLKYTKKNNESIKKKQRKI